MTDTSLCTVNHFVCVFFILSPFEPMHDKINKMTCAPSEDRSARASAKSSLCAQWVAKDPMLLHADNEDSDQTGWMPRLI